jgi:hypothetical protein
MERRWLQMKGHADNCDADIPYRRTVAKTRRDPAKLSTTIRRFSFCVQHLRATIVITSSRETFDIGV